MDSCRKGSYQFKHFRSANENHGALFDSTILAFKQACEAPITEPNSAVPGAVQSQNNAVPASGAHDTGECPSCSVLGSSQHAQASTNMLLRQRSSHKHLSPTLALKSLRRIFSFRILSFSSFFAWIRFCCSAKRAEMFLSRAIIASSSSSSSL